MPRTLPVPDVGSSRPVRVALAAVLVVGLLGGCSSGGSAPVTASTSSVTTVAASPSPTPTAAAKPSPTATPKPERPAAMGTGNLDGAIATATYFLQLFPYALNTGDLSEWSLLTNVECKFCASVADDVKNLTQLGQHQEGTDITVQAATGVEIRPGASFSIEITFTQGLWTVVDPAGKVVDAAAAPESLHALVVVLREMDHWSIRAVQIDPNDG